MLSVFPHCSRRGSLPSNLPWWDGICYRYSRIAREPMVVFFIDCDLLEFQIVTVLPDSSAATATAPRPCALAVKLFAQCDHAAFPTKIRTIMVASFYHKSPVCSPPGIGQTANKRKHRGECR